MKVTVKDRIINIMRDGRERTATEIGERLEVRDRNVRTMLYLLRKEEIVSSDAIGKTVTVWRITEQGKALPSGGEN
jgi:predicted ArsR family transcriptional regulator